MTLGKGSRVRLIHTDDLYTDLKAGAMGTVTDITEVDLGNGIPCFRQIWVDWDSGSKLALIDGKDEYAEVKR